MTNPEQVVPADALPDGVRVRWADAATAAFDASAAVERAGAAQVARFAGLPPAPARRFALGRLLLVDLIAEISGAPGAVDTVCDHCGGNHGAPKATSAPVRLSLSYAGDLVVAAAAHCDIAGGLGVDVEATDSRSANAPLDELRPLFAGHEPPTLREWVRIEAAVKADGRGLRVDPASVEFSSDARTAVIPGRAAPLRVFDVAAPEGYLISLAGEFPAGR